MKIEDLCIFLTGYTMTVAFAATLIWRYRRRASYLWHVLLAMVAVIATTIVGFYFEPGINYLDYIRMLIRTRDFSAFVSLAMGMAAGTTWLALVPTTEESHNDSAGNRRVFAHLCLVGSLLGVVACGQAFIWKEILGAQRDPAVTMRAPGFAVEHIAKLDFLPLRLAADNQGRVYVNYDYFEVWGAMGGAILELSPDPNATLYKQRIVADSPLLMRSYGLIYRDGEFFVSRTGIQGHATEGKVTYEDAGAVTRLRDTDGDGYFEYAHDLVTGLPGARGPDTMQQNNDICFGPDGSLFITTSSASNRTLDRHPWAGCILKANPDFSHTDVYARGFRNPFGLVIGPDGELFATDNDIDENPGDELNHVVDGGHYGHPFVVPGEPGVVPEGFVEPILVSEMESNYLSMVYATSPKLPEEYRNCIYMTDYMGDAVLRLKLERDGDTYRVTDVIPFVTITTPVDIVATDDGEFFVNSRRTQNVYRIRLTGAPTDEDATVGN